MRKFSVILILLVVILAGIAAVYFLSGGTETPRFLTTQAVHREIKMTVSTNGIIEPLERNEVYAPVDGLVARIPLHEGAEILQGQLLMELESEQIRTALANANTALLEARRQEKTVLTGPSGEELAELDASIAEASLELEQVNKDLAVEETLFAKGAVARVSLDNLRKQKAQLQLRVDGRKRRKQEVIERYSTEEKQWEKDKVRELTGQLQFLEQQKQMESVAAPRSGLIYALEVKTGAYVAKGQLLARINQPGKIRLRAYVDEPDLGRVAKGQPVTITWDGLPDREWIGVVEKPAEQVVAMNNRTIGYVLCSVEGEPKELIPNLNVKVEITTARKPDALVVPRSAVFSPGGKPSVLVFNGKTAVKTPVALGVVTSEEIEILEGVQAGDNIVTNPLETQK